jgi:hypothetical protein
MSKIVIEIDSEEANEAVDKLRDFLFAVLQMKDDIGEIKELLREGGDDEVVGT